MAQSPGKRYRLAVAACLFCAGLLLGALPIQAQQQGQSDNTPPYVKLEETGNTYNWIAAAAMLAVTMGIAFKKPKRADIR